MVRLITFRYKIFTQQHDVDSLHITGYHSVHAFIAILVCYVITNFLGGRNESVVAAHVCFLVRVFLRSYRLRLIVVICFLIYSRFSLH